MLAHYCGEATTVVAHAEFVVNLTGDQGTFVPGDAAKLERECSRRVGKPGPRFIAVEDLGLRVKVLKSWDLF